MVGFSTQELASMREDYEVVNLTMRCTVQRFVSSGTDPDGHATGNWVDHLVNLPCWYWEIDRWRSSIEEVSGPNINAAVSFPRLTVPHGTDITTHDRITQVIGVPSSEGAIAVNLNIRTVLKRLYNILITVEADK